MADNPKFGFHRSNWWQLSLHSVLAVLIGVSLRLTTFKEATAVASQLGDKYVLKTSFLVSFGFTKALSNLVVGRVSDIWGRQLPHALGWGFGILLGGLLLEMVSTNDPHLVWITYVMANICLGAQQGFTWTTNIFMLLDLLGPQHRALASAISNSVGYLTSAFTTYAAAYLSTEGAFGLVLATGVVGCFVSTFLVQDTTHFVSQEEIQSAIDSGMQEMVPCYSDKVDEEGNEKETSTTTSDEEEEERKGEVHPASGDLVGSVDSFPAPPSSFGTVFWNTCWQNPSALVLCWGGLTANLVTSLAWGLVLIWGQQQDLTGIQLANIGSAFTFAKGIAMIVSGYLSDRNDSRKSVLVGGYLVAVIGLLLTAWADKTRDPASIYKRLCLGGVVIGTGIGSVYCVLTAGLSDHTPPRDRASAIGVYKLWRDSGYAFGGLLTGWIADASGGSFVTTTSVVAGLVVALVISIAGMYKEVQRSAPTFEPLQQNP